MIAVYQESLAATMLRIEVPASSHMAKTCLAESSNDAHVLGRGLIMPVWSLFALVSDHRRTLKAWIEHPCSSGEDLIFQRDKNRRFHWSAIEKCCSMYPFSFLMGD